MRSVMICRWVSAVLLTLIGIETVTAQDAISVDEPVVEVQVEPGLLKEPRDGRLYVLFSKSLAREPRQGPSWFGPEPFYGIQLKAVQDGKTYVVDDESDGFPGAISELAAGSYAVQAIFDHDFYHSNHNNGVGNIYSDKVVVDWNPTDDGTKLLKLTLSHTIADRPFRNTQYAKQVKIYSPRLSAFHGHEVIQKAGVLLPASYYDNPDKRYPVIYSVTGFGGMHESVEGSEPVPVEPGDVEFIRVILDGQCKWGHHTYANSAKNGPRGDALVHELIPEIERRFRTVAESTARFLTGHSSGGWSSLWLQVNYPAQFAGTWSTAPDVVDFRDYQEVNLYHDPPLSLYTKPNGDRRGIARRGDQVLIWYDDFGKMDDCLGRGGQLRSFEAVFSPLDDFGQPIKMWTRDSGTVIPQTVKYWMEYDINHLIQRRWSKNEQHLKGKIHVIMGTLDTFYLEGACEQIKTTLAKLDPTAVIDMVEGDHGSFMTRAMRDRIRSEMSAAYRKFHD